MRIILYPFYWFLDYWYVARMQLLSLFIRNNPEKYRNKNGYPILLIPGVYENWRFISPIAKVLFKEGYDVRVIAGLGYNRGTVEAMADVVAEYIQTNKIQNAIIVSHSKGGLIGQYLLSFMKSPYEIKGLVSLNAPFTGSRYAYLLPFRSLRIFIPNSKILKYLALNRTVNNKIISIYGLFDPHIPTGSNLEGAENVQLPIYGHFRVVNDARVHEAILSSIKKIVVK